MATIDLALPFTLPFEGGFTNNPNDPGGATYAGITLETLRRHHGDIDHDGVIDENDVKLLQQHAEMVEQIYREDYWPSEYDQLVNQPVATKLFDCGVNMGLLTAGTLAQKEVAALGGRVSIDGHVGMLTVIAMNNCDPVKFLFGFAQQMGDHYWNIVKSQIQARAVTPFNDKPALGWNAQQQAAALDAISRRDQAHLGQVLHSLSPAAKPGLAVFMPGWLRRANAIPQES